jgi:hypothetical protein
MQISKINMLGSVIAQHKISDTNNKQIVKNIPAKIIEDIVVKKVGEGCHSKDHDRTGCGGEGCGFSKEHSNNCGGN